MKLKLLAAPLPLLALVGTASLGPAQIQIDEMLALDGASQDSFGFAVTIEGNTAIVGARLADFGGLGAPQDNDNAGAAYVFEKSATGWSQTLKLTANDPTLEGGFGVSVAARVLDNLVVDDKGTPGNTFDDDVIRLTTLVVGADCGLNDLGVPEVNSSVFYAAGFVTGRDGTANVDARLNAGALPVGIDVLVPGELMPGNGFGAEVHMIVRSHGAIITGEADVQVGTFNGACDINICEDQQAVIFLPVE